MNNEKKAEALLKQTRFLRQSAYKQFCVRCLKEALTAFKRGNKALGTERFHEAHYAFQRARALSQLI